MIELIFLFLPSIWCAPRAPINTCQESGCKVSGPSLDSALATFLCYTENEYGAMEELEKRIKLAEKIVPVLLSEDGGEAKLEKLLAMDSEPLVRLVNLVLHNRDNEAQAVERKTEERYIDQVIEELKQKTKLHFVTFDRTNSHFLALMNCEMKNGIINEDKLPEGLTSLSEGDQDNSERRGRGSFIMRFFDGLFSKTAAPTTPTSTATPTTSTATAMTTKDGLFSTAPTTPTSAPTTSTATATTTKGNLACESDVVISGGTCKCGVTDDCQVGSICVGGIVCNTGPVSPVCVPNVINGIGECLCGTTSCPDGKICLGGSTCGNAPSACSSVDIILTGGACICGTSILCEPGNLCTEIAEAGCTGADCTTIRMCTPASQATIDLNVQKVELAALVSNLDAVQDKISNIININNRKKRSSTIASCTHLIAETKKINGFLLLLGEHDLKLLDDICKSITDIDDPITCNPTEVNDLTKEMDNIKSEQDKVKDKIVKLEGILQKINDALPACFYGATQPGAVTASCICGTAVCGEGNTCKDGNCIPECFDDFLPWILHPCFCGTTNTICGVGSTCKNGVCTPGKCTDGSVVSAAIGICTCGDNTDCGEGSTCTFGICTPGNDLFTTKNLTQSSPRSSFGSCSVVQIKEDLIETVCVAEGSLTTSSSFEIGKKTYNFKNNVPPKSILFESNCSRQAILTCNAAKRSVYGSIQLENSTLYLEPQANNNTLACNQTGDDMPPEGHVPDTLDDEDTDTNTKRKKRATDDKTTEATYSIKFYYTPDFAAATPDIPGFLDQAVAVLNQGYINSNIPLTAFILCSEMATINDIPDADKMLEEFTFMKGNIKALRGGADVAALLIMRFSAGGIGWFNTVTSKSLTASVTAKNNVLGYYTLGHEIGHNIGCAHDKLRTTNNKYAYGHGAQIKPPNPGHRTIMAYCSKGYYYRVNHYSNPDVTFDSRYALNSPTGVEGESNNARVITENRFILESIGDENSCGYSACESDKVIPADGTCSCGDSPCPEGSTCDGGNTCNVPECTELGSGVSCLCGNKVCTSEDTCNGGICTPPACTDGAVPGTCLCGNSASVCNAGETCTCKVGETCTCTPSECTDGAVSGRSCQCGTSVCAVLETCLKGTSTCTKPACTHEAVAVSPCSCGKPATSICATGETCIEKTRSSYRAKTHSLGTCISSTTPECSEEDQYLRRPVSEDCICPKVKGYGVRGTRVCTASLLERCTRGTCYTPVCKTDQFKCRSGNCVELNKKCNGEDDCNDNSDEENCPDNVCSANQFSCSSGNQCIHGGWRCDWHADCDDGSDEENCNDACVDGYVVPAGTCTCGTTPCREGSTCTSGICTPPPACVDGSVVSASLGNCICGTELCGEGSTCARDGVRWQCKPPPACADGFVINAAVGICTCGSTTCKERSTCKSGTCIPGPCNCGVPNKPAFPPRIFGGEDADPHEFPWQVGLLFGGRGTTPTCGGSLISSNTVLTAAHCTAGQSANDILVLVGDHNLTQADGEYKIAVKEIIQHPKYNGRLWDYDFSLLTLMKAVEWSSVASPVCLPQNPSSSYENIMATVAGWGKLSSGQTPTILQKVDLKTMSNTFCKNPHTYYYNEITSNMICAGDPGKDGKDACRGDSGGPLIAKETAGSFSQIGVVSWGYKCGHPKSPGVYARVTSEQEWIRRNIKGTTCPVVKPCDDDAVVPAHVGWCVCGEPDENNPPEYCGRGDTCKNGICTGPPLPESGEDAPTSNTDAPTSNTATLGSCRFLSVCSTSQGCNLVKNKSITTLTKLDKEFSVSFEFQATQYTYHLQSVIEIYSKFQSILSLGVKDFGKLEYRLHRLNWDKFKTTKEYPVSKWHHVEFSQALNGESKYIFQLKVNGIIEGAYENKNPETFSDVAVYVANPWKRSLKGSFRNLIINTEGSTKCGGLFASSKLSRSSSIYETNSAMWGPQFAIDGKMSMTSTKLFVSALEDYPWLEIELSEPMLIDRMILVNREDCCGYRLKNAEIRAGMDKVPDGTTNQILDINKVCASYEGPGASGSDLQIACGEPVLTKYITIQLKDKKSILQINEISALGVQACASDGVVSGASCMCGTITCEDGSFCNLGTTPEICSKACASEGVVSGTSCACGNTVCEDTSYCKLAVGTDPAICTTACASNVVIPPDGTCACGVTAACQVGSTCVDEITCTLPACDSNGVIPTDEACKCGSVEEACSVGSICDGTTCTLPVCAADVLLEVFGGKCLCGTTACADGKVCSGGNTCEDAPSGCISNVVVAGGKCLCTTKTCPDGNICSGGITCEDAPAGCISNELVAGECVCGTKICSEGKVCSGGNRCEDAPPDCTPDDLVAGGKCLCGTTNCHNGKLCSGGTTCEEAPPDCISDERIGGGKCLCGATTCPSGKVCSGGTTCEDVPDCTSDELITGGKCLCGTAPCTNKHICIGGTTCEFAPKDCAYDSLVKDEKCLCGTKACPVMTEGNVCLGRTTCETAPPACTTGGEAAEDSCLCGTSVCQEGDRCTASSSSCIPDGCPDLTLDVASWCGPQYASYCTDSRYKQYMQKRCPSTCYVCGDCSEGETVRLKCKCGSQTCKRGETCSEGVCKPAPCTVLPPDTLSYCNQYLRYCSRSPWVIRTCPTTCNQC